MFYFLVNITGGSGRTRRIWRQIREVLAERDIGYKAYRTEGDEHVRRLAGRLSRLPDDHDIRIVVVGGDGTVNNVINGISDFGRVSLAVIPTGSGNDFARGLRLPADPMQVLDDILDCAPADLSSDEEAQVTHIKSRAPVRRRLDLGKITWEGGERLFAISGGIGLDALVCKQALTSKLKNVLNRIGLGQMIYSILTVGNLFTMKYLKGKAVFSGTDEKNPSDGRNLTDDSVVVSDQMIFLAAMNFPAEGGGVPMAPGADAEDGKLSVCAVAGIPRIRTFFCFPRLLAAKHEHINGFIIRDCRAVTLSLESPAVVHADGEYVGDLKTVTFECVPGALRCLQ